MPQPLSNQTATCDAETLSTYIFHILEGYSHGNQLSVAERLASLDRLIREAESFRTTSTLPEIAVQAFTTLRLHRNSYVHLNVFPPELLRVMFLEASGRNVTTKFAIAATCARWRSVCLAFTRYWTDFELPASWGQASQALLRACDVAAPLPLRISIDWKTLGDASERTLALLDMHTHRIENLEMSNWSGSWPTSASNPFSSLRHLTVAVERDLAWRGGALVSPHVLETSSLRDVDLNGCRLPYSPQFYRQMTRLSIVFPSQKRHLSGPSQAEGSLIDCLRACSQLEELTLRRIPTYHLQDAATILSHANDIESGANGVTDRISLPQLRFLDLQLYPDDMTVLLALFNTSATLRSIRLDVDVPRGLLMFEWDRLAPLKDHLLSMPSTESFPALSAIDTLVLHHRNEINQKSPNHRTTSPGCPPQQNPNSRRSLHIGLDWNADDPLHAVMLAAYDNLFLTFLHDHTLHHLQRLSIRLDSPSSFFAKYLASVVRAAPSIVDLDVLDTSGGNTPWLFPILQSTKHDCGHGASSPGLEKLATLTLVRCVLPTDVLDQLNNMSNRCPSLRVVRMAHCCLLRALPLDDVARHLRSRGLTIIWE
ncbi:hypothetical protein C8Q76DRAFT_853117 [Earliella scabrosa]|nr:hypothetical protein C8Q76DRAFT_853117 [Earliella scabrosa]